MQKITPFLWFNKEAREAALFYTTLFGGDSKVVMEHVMHDTPSGEVEVVGFTLWGFAINAMSAGPLFKPTPALSISVQCKDEAEIDRLHAGLMDGGTELMPLQKYPWSEKYAWVNDKYGFSWQLNIPTEMPQNRIALSFLFVGKVCGKAEEAIAKYVSIFPDAKITLMAKHEEGAPGNDTPGTVKHAEFQLAGQTFMALDSAAEHKFSWTEAFSLVVDCKDQAEVDYYWEKLIEGGGAESVCGWLKDPYGVSWQVTPTRLTELTMSADKEVAARATQAMLKMKKIDLAALEAAVAGG